MRRPYPSLPQNHSSCNNYRFIKRATILHDMVSAGQASPRLPPPSLPICQRVGIRKRKSAFPAHTFFVHTLPKLSPGFFGSISSGTATRVRLVPTTYEGNMLPFLNTHSLPSTEKTRKIERFARRRIAMPSSQCSLRDVSSRQSFRIICCYCALRIARHKKEEDEVTYTSAFRGLGGSCPNRREDACRG